MMPHFWSSCYLIVWMLMAVPTECTAVPTMLCEEASVEIYGAKGQNVSLPCPSTDPDPALIIFTLVKLPEGKETEKLLYSTNNLTTKEQRWSLEWNSGRAMFVLNKGSLSDSGWYKCEVRRYQDCLKVSRLFLKIRECEILEKVEAVLNSVATLTCPISMPTQVAWEVVQGDNSLSIQPCNSSCVLTDSNRSNPKPQCERMKTVQDPVTGRESLIIRPVQAKDASWYRCKVEAMQYCAEVKIIIADEKPFQVMTKECKYTDPFRAMVNSSVTISCPALTLHPGAKQVIWRTIEGEQTFPTSRCPSVCSSSSTSSPLCERLRILENGSLTISSVDFTDAQWFWCAVNNTSCSKFKLTVTGIHFASEAETISVFSNVTSDLQTLQYPSKPPESSSEDTMDISSNLTVIVTLSIMSVFIVLPLLVTVGFRLRKQKRKRKAVHRIELEDQYTAYEELIKNDNVMYSLVHYEPGTMGTFQVQQREQQDQSDKPATSPKCENDCGI